MASGKRRDSESFEEYRERLKREKEEEKKKLSGRLVWCSSAIAFDEEESEAFAPVFKEVGVEGTFDRSKGSKLHGSIAERNKYHRMLDKLKKRGVI